MDIGAWQEALMSSALVEAVRALLHGGADFAFLRPWWLLGLIGLPPLLWRWWRRQRGQQVWRDAIDPHLLRHLLQSDGAAGDGRKRRIGRALGALALTVGYAAMFLALAGPSWRKQPQPLWQDRSPLVIALDLSERILATDLPPSRLQRARAEIAEILRRRGGGQMALVAYAGDAFTVSPLTEDAANIALYLDALHPNVMPSRGSRTDRGIDEAALLLRRAGFRNGEILVITDMLDGDDRRAKSAASDAVSDGYRVSVLGLASERGAQRLVRGVAEAIRLDGSALASLASAGKGRYAPIAADDSDLRALGVLQSQRIDATDAGGKRGAIAIDEGYWLLPLLMLAAVFSFRRGVLAVALLCCLPWQPAQAADGSLWLRRDQQEHRAMRQASEAFQRRDYAAAERIWSELPGVDADYNRGNALARQGRYPEAIDAYDEALRARPDMADAIENRRAVVEAMRRKPPQQPPNDQKNDPKKGQKNDQKNDQQKDQQKDQKNQDKNDRKDDQQQQKQNDPKDGQGQKPKDPKGSDGKPQDRQDPQQKPEGQKPSPDAASPKPGDDKPNDPKAQRDADAAQRERMARALAGRQPPPTTNDKSRQETPQEQQVRVLNEARLRRVPDDPGGLLRAKFEQEQRRRARGEARR